MTQPKTVEQFFALPICHGLFGQENIEVDGKKVNIPFAVNVSAPFLEEDSLMGAVDEDGLHWGLVNIDGILHRFRGFF